MKGAVDGGIHIPHSDSIFPKAKEVEKEKTKAPKEKGDKKEEKGDKKEGKETAKEPKTAPSNPLRDRLFGLHVQKYMDVLSKTPEAMNRQFRKWSLCLKENKATKVEEVYKKVFAEIRKNPQKAPGKKKEQKKIGRDGSNPALCTNGKHKYLRHKKLNREQRKNRVADKIQQFVAERQKAAKKAK